MPKFSLSFGIMLLVPLEFLLMQSFGERNWEQGTGSYIIYFHDNGDYVFAEIAWTWDICHSCFVVQV